MDKRDIIVLTALPEEFSTVEDTFSKNGITLHRMGTDGTYFAKIKIRGNLHTVVVKSSIGMGNITAAAATASALAQYHPALAIFIGIGAVMDVDKYRLGDVVIVDGIQSKSFQKITDRKRGTPLGASLQPYGTKYALRMATPEFLPQVPKTSRLLTAKHWRGIDGKFASPAIDADLIRGFGRTLRPTDRNCKCVREMVFSWDLVLDSDDFRNEILSQEGKLAAVDMESLGFFSVIEGYNHGDGFVDAVAFRGLSDYATNKANTDGSAVDWRRVAGANAANAAYDFLQAVNFSDLGPASAYSA
jgi:nucleoside phosphorylase